MDRLLARPDFAEANAAFEARGGKPGWYRALGKPNIRAIAEELKRLPEHNIYYRRASEVVYSSGVKQHVAFEKRGTVGHPIRNLADNVSQSAMLTFLRMLAFYRPRELGAFRR